MHLLSETNHRKYIDSGTGHKYSLLKKAIGD